MKQGCIIAALCLLLLGNSGCSMRRRTFNNYHAGERMQTIIDSKHCHDINELDYVCDGVIFRSRFRPAQ